VKKVSRKKPGSALSRLLDTLPLAEPAFSVPMKCRLRASLPEGPQWAYEIKFDGYRALAVKDGPKVRLLSRNDREMRDKFPGVVRAVEALACEQLVLDGEVVALDAAGKSSFQKLQRAGDAGPRGQVASLFYYAFDVLNVNGRDVRGLPLHRRKAILKTVLKPSKGQADCLRVSEALPGEAAELSAAMRGLGLE
jgi:bifunctional non-homologous end joining protein LigD